MKLDGNTIFITGGGSGIGRGLAEALHRLGNKVIISGRRRSVLDAVVGQNPGMEAVQLDVTNLSDIETKSRAVIAQHPELNVLFNNAGVWELDRVDGRVDDETVTSTIATNLTGAIRVTSAFVDHLKTRDQAVIAYTSSILGFVPLAAAAVHSATKAAIHSYVLSQRFLLRNTRISVLELAPPRVQTGHMGRLKAKNAMPLEQFVAQTMAVLATQADEILVEAAYGFRDNAGPDEHDLVTAFNAQMSASLAA
jgi:uncharacterized oxidoreductase